jgi:hypothetical protein
MSLFQRTERRAGVTVDGYHAEWLICSAKADTRKVVGAGSAGSTSRPDLRFKALFFTNSGEKDLSGETLDGRWQTQLPYCDARVDVRPEAIPDGYFFRQGDRIVADDRPGRPSFEIAHVDSTGLGRISLRLNIIGG